MSEHQINYQQKNLDIYVSKICSVSNENIEISGNLDVDGDVSFNSNLDVSGRLDVNGDVSLNSDVDISGQLTVMDNLDVDGDVSFNSNLDVSGRLDVNGDVSLNSDVDISGQLTVMDNLHVSGVATFDSDVTLSSLPSISNNYNNHSLMLRNSNNKVCYDTSTSLVIKSSTTGIDVYLRCDRSYPDFFVLGKRHAIESAAATRKHNLLCLDEGNAAVLSDESHWVRSCTNMYILYDCLYLTGGINTNNPDAYWIATGTPAWQNIYWQYLGTQINTLSIIATNFIRAAGYFAYSDDRVKHNEIDISNNLHIIRQLKPKIYQKTTEMYAADYRGDISGSWSIELGLIAQDLFDISYFRFCVEGGDYTDDSGNLVEQLYTVNYNDIFVAHIAATQELDGIVQSQAQEIQDLSSEINSLKQQNINLTNENAIIKAALNNLLIAAGEPTI